METKLYTFIDIFNTEFQVKTGEGMEKNVKLKQIVIPIIQRDYAQGRLSADVTRVRNRFLEALKKSVTEKSITLDFVYGNVDLEGVLTPLDGQQRLTTLFLLHWYVAKKENIPFDKYDFLNNFSYETRYSARDFCHELVNNTFSFNYNSIQEEIIDQSWFPLDWKRDPTINSMLVMLDAISDKFKDITNIWQKLEDGCISFYFLPIRDMGLTDELYIKMNSRGKPLTNFEHFKAELEQHLRKYDDDIAKRIINKIDINWTDMLWQYRGDDNVTDDEFLRYFTFICDIICYKHNLSPQGKSHDPFYLIDEYFSVGSDDLQNNISLLESYFDCWCELSKAQPNAYCSSLMSKQHEEGKVMIEERYDVDIFNDCLRSYGELQNNGNRMFPLGRTIILYTLVSNLCKQCNDFAHKLRIINNLVRNSGDEISDSENRKGGNHLPAILRQVDSLLHADIITNELGFNINQIQEEQLKYAWTKEHPEQSEMLFAIEDHPLLYGQIGILGLDNIEYFSRFRSLFTCDWELIGKAMLAFGDYKQKESDEWRYQLGSSMESSWKFLFHKSSAYGYEQTKKVLGTLLSSTDDFSDQYLQKLINTYIEDCEKSKHFGWQYYYLKYPSFCPGRFGKYQWTDFDNSPYIILVLYAHYYPSGNAYIPFLNEIDAENINRDDLGQSLVYDNRIVRMNNDSFVAYDNNKEAYRLNIPMNEDGTDAVDRIILAKNSKQLLHKEKK
jgi:hypothetical protein